MTPKNINFTPAQAREWLILAGMLGGIIVWCVTMWGLPPRVEKLEDRVSAHDRQLATVNVKMDIVLDDVKTIKAHILNKD